MLLLSELAAFMQLLKIIETRMTSAKAIPGGVICQSIMFSHRHIRNSSAKYNILHSVSAHNLSHMAD